MDTQMIICMHSSPPTSPPHFISPHIPFTQHLTTFSYIYIPSFSLSHPLSSCFIHTYTLHLRGYEDNNNTGIITTTTTTGDNIFSSLNLEKDELTDVDLGLKSSVGIERRTIVHRMKENAAVLKAVHLGCGFCLLFIGFGACQDLVTTFHEKDGSAGLAILYIVYGLSSFIAPVVVEKIGIRLSLLISALVYVTFIICVEPYLDFLFFPISAVEGVAAAVLWTAQPVYLSKCAPDPSVIGKFSGITSGALLSSSIKEEDLLYILAVVSLSGAIALGLLRDPKTVVTVRDNRLMTTPAFDVSEFSYKSHASPPTSPVPESKKIEQPPNKSPLDLVIRTLRLCVTKKMLWLHPLFIHQGLSNAIFMGAFPMQMSANRIGFVIAVFGVSNVAGSVFWGKMYDWKGWKPLVLTALFLGPLAYFTSSLRSIGLWPLFLAAVGFGVLDSCQNTLVFGILSSIYPEEQEQICAFAVSKFSNACASGIFFFSISYLSYKTMAAMATGNIILVCACISGLYMWQSIVWPTHPVFAFLDRFTGQKHNQFHDEI